MADLSWDRARFEAFAEAQRALAARFGDPRHWVAERARLARALQAELAAVLDGMPDEDLTAV